MSEQVTSIETLADEICCKVEGIGKAIFDGTNCGAWIACKTDGITVGSIVEGVEQCTQTYELLYPFPMSEFWQALDDVDKEAGEIWDATHGCPQCWGVEGEEFMAAGEHTPVDPFCPNCHGKGWVI